MTNRRRISLTPYLLTRALFARSVGHGNGLLRAGRSHCEGLCGLVRRFAGCSRIFLPAHPIHRKVSANRVMSQTISSSALFHFTKSINAIKSILRDGFFPHYCPEYSLDREDRAAASRGHHPLRAIPMVSFCDLPLSLIREHLDQYGPCGIGLTKEWGIHNRVAPVIYTHSRARTRPSVSRLVAKAPVTIDGQTLSDMQFLAAYSKPFEGPAWRNNRVQKKVRFYDEREWRYVPATGGKPALFLDWAEYRDVSKRTELHNRFKRESALPIPPGAIQYLILPFKRDEQNILELHDFIRSLYSRKDAILVTTTIMTDNCITEDI